MHTNMTSAFQKDLIRVGKKVDKMHEEGKYDFNFINMNISKNILDKLYDHQILHVYNLMSILSDNGVALDSSFTGLGKTYSSIAISCELRLVPYIVCTKMGINNWKKVCEFFNVTPMNIINYESFDPTSVNTYKKTLLIFDEVHKCKNPNTETSKKLQYFKGKCKILMISATVSDKMKSFKVFGYMLNCYKSLSSGTKWIHSIEVRQNNTIDKKRNLLFEEIYPSKCSRMIFENVRENFPKNRIITECYDITPGEQKIINKHYEDIRHLSELNKINSAREQIESVKINILCEEAVRYLDSGLSVVIFVNYINSVNLLSKKFKKIDHLIISGKISQECRDDSINRFQSNQCNLLIMTLQSGCESISLHDLHGGHPRVSLISPSYSSINLIQALGRIYRTGAKSHVIQKIIYCNDTYEIHIYNNIKNKLDFMDTITDSDLKI